MPRYCTGNLWADPATLLLFAGNSVVDTHDCLVMGAGSAREAKMQCPTLPRQLGRILAQRHLQHGLYGLLFCKTNVQVGDHWQAKLVGAFQTKRHWRDPADPQIIAYSVGRLCGYLEALPGMQHLTVAMPFPGIGYGGLAREQVLPLLAPLPDTVTVYEYPSSGGEAV